MKFATLIFLVGVVALALAAECPATIPQDDKAEYLIPSSDCTKFSKCLPDGVKVPQDCPEGLHFNPDLKVCDWPANAGCKGGA